MKNNIIIKPHFDIIASASISLYSGLQKVHRKSNNDATNGAGIPYFEEFSQIYCESNPSFISDFLVSYLFLIVSNNYRFCTNVVNFDFSLT